MERTTEIREIVIRREGINAHFNSHIYHVCEYDNLSIINSFTSENEAIGFCIELGYNINNIIRYY